MKARNTCSLSRKSVKKIDAMLLFQVEREEKTKKKGRAEAEHGADREYNFVIEG